MLEQVLGIGDSKEKQIFYNAVDRLKGDVYLTEYGVLVGTYDTIVFYNNPFEILKGKVVPISKHFIKSFCFSFDGVEIQLDEDTYHVKIGDLSWYTQEVYHNSNFNLLLDTKDKELNRKVKVYNDINFYCRTVPLANEETSFDYIHFIEGKLYSTDRKLFSIMELKSDYDFEVSFTRKFGLLLDLFDNTIQGNSDYTNLAVMKKGNVLVSCYSIKDDKGDFKDKLDYITNKFNENEVYEWYVNFRDILNLVNRFVGKRELGQLNICISLKLKEKEVILSSDGGSGVLPCKGSTEHEIKLSPSVLGYLTSYGNCKIRLVKEDAYLPIQVIKDRIIVWTMPLLKD